MEGFVVIPKRHHLDVNIAYAAYLEEGKKLNCLRNGSKNVLSSHKSEEHWAI